MGDRSHIRPGIGLSAERAQYISDSPVQYAREVGFHLQHRTLQKHETLFELHHVVWNYNDEHLASHTDLMCTLIEEGLVSHLMKFAFSDDFWCMREASTA